jgi:hypothetical protein
MDSGENFSFFNDDPKTYHFLCPVVQNKPVIASQDDGVKTVHRLQKYIDISSRK